MCEVSLFENYRSSIPSSKVAIDEWLLNSTYKKQVEKIRQEEDTQKRRLMKSGLPCITPSGLFSRRSKAGLLKHSGFVCIDIDGKENPDIDDWQALKSTIAEQVENYTTVVYRCQGMGYFALFLLQSPKDT